MKINGMECPYCGSTNTYAWQIEKARIFDDSTYEALEKEFGKSRSLSTSADNIIYGCECNDCQKHFVSMAILEVKAKKVISRKTVEEVMRLKVGEV